MPSTNFTTLVAEFPTIVTVDDYGRGDVQIFTWPSSAPGYWTVRCGCGGARVCLPCLVAFALPWRCLPLAQSPRFNSTHLAWPPPLPSWSPQVTPSALADLAEGLDACANSPTPFGAAVDASSEELDASASLSAWPVFLNLKTTLTRQQPTSSSYYIQAGVQCCQHP